ncbi:MAG: ABC transporter substrate-binding protein [Micrococcaceae bacterium]
MSNSSRLKKRWSVSAIVSVVALALTGCGGNAAGDGADDEQVIKWGVSGNPPGNWDPVVTGATGATLTMTPIYEPLLNLDEDGNPAPGLVESWDYNEEGTAVTFTLKEGLSFHDGSPVDAEAAKAYIERAIEQPNSALAGSYNNIDEVVVEDDLNFTVHLHSVDYQIPYLFAIRAGLLTSQEAVEEDPEAFNASNPVGAGPFKVVELVPESKIVLEKFDDYWNAENIHIDRIEIDFGIDENSLVPAAQTGTYNFVTIRDAAAVETARQANLDLVEDISLNWYVGFLSINENQEPFDDPRVVAAVRHAVNSEEIVERALLGEGEAVRQPVPPGHILFNEDLEEEFPYDPERARELLEEAGLEDGIDVTLESNPNVLDAVNEQLQAQLAAVGIRININKDPNWQEGYFGKSFTLATYMYVGRNSHAQTLTEHYDEGGVLNLSSPATSPEFQEALATLRGTPVDDDGYLDTAREASAEGYKNGTTVALYSEPIHFAKSSEVSSNFENREGFLNWTGVTVGDQE